LACEARLLDKWGLEYPTSGPLFLTPFLNYRISKEEFLPLGTEAEDHTTTVRNYSVSFPELSRHTDFPLRRDLLCISRVLSRVLSWVREVLDRTHVPITESATSKNYFITLKIRASRNGLLMQTLAYIYTPSYLLF